jgi:hypothetical protein
MLNLHNSKIEFKYRQFWQFDGKINNKLQENEWKLKIFP